MQICGKKIEKEMLALGLTFSIIIGMAGCGKEEQMKAETNPDTPVSEVQFPLKEKAELSFITNAPATSTQNPNERIIFKRLEKETNVHIVGLVLWRISSRIRRTLRWLSSEIFRMGCLMQE